MKLPPLVAMILMGAVARNLFTWESEAYHDMGASYMRIVCLMVILLRGGLEITFKGKGLIVFLFTIVPCFVEATAVMLVAWLIVGMPFVVAYAMGFMCAAVSPAILVPAMLSLAKRGFGIKKGIPNTLLAASSLDDIGAITLFMVFAMISLNGKGGDDTHVVLAILANVYQIAAGVALGLFLGLFAWPFKRLKCTGKWGNLAKLAFLMLNVGIIFGVCEPINFQQTRFIAIIKFGHMCHCFWHEDKPEKHLEVLWMVLMPFLFGSVGAAIKLEEMKLSYLGIGLGCFSFGLVMRWIASFLIGYVKKYNLKEKLFAACAWMPKATVQAAIGGLILDNVRSDIPEGDVKDEYIEYGFLILSTAVISVIVSAPLGAIITNTFGPKLLTNDLKDLPPGAKIDPATGNVIEVESLKIRPIEFMDKDLREINQQRSVTKIREEQGVSVETFNNDIIAGEAGQETRGELAFHRKTLETNGSRGGSILPDIHQHQSAPFMDEEAGTKGASNDNEPSNEGENTSNGVQPNRHEDV